ncbi:MAG: SGNH/GDSL hydrolase family protein [Sulfitobacter sp.]
MRQRPLILAFLCLIHMASMTWADPLRILVMGDSFMTSNGSVGHSVPAIIKRELPARVRSTAVLGASYGYRLPITGALGLNISKQYRKGPWDVVVMNGGGNDLWLGCGCSKCDARLERLISRDGLSGQIPKAVTRAVAAGAQVFYVGYLRSPGVGSPIEHCRTLGDALEKRLQQMAKRYRAVTFVSLANLVPRGDRSFHAGDMIHPSPKGSTAAARRIIAAIKANR